MTSVPCGCTAVSINATTTRSADGETSGWGSAGGPELIASGSRLPGGAIEKFVSTDATSLSCSSLARAPRAAASSPNRSRYAPAASSRATTVAPNRRASASTPASDPCFSATISSVGIGRLRRWSAFPVTWMSSVASFTEFR